MKTAILAGIFSMSMVLMAVCVGCTDSSALSASTETPEVLTNSAQILREMAAADMEKASYITNGLQLYGIHSDYYTSEDGRRMAGVKFKVRNRGQRSVSLIEVTAVFRDSSYSIIGEEKFYPIHPDLPGSRPLKSGFIWEIPGGGFFPAKSVASEWKVGATGVRITDIEFSK